MSGRVILCAALLTAGCAGSAQPTSQTSASTASGAVAPNASILSGRVLDAVVVESTTLGIEPPQPICVLTLSVTASEAPGDRLPAEGGPGGELRLYTKDTTLTSLKGGSLKASVTLRGDGRSERLWLVQVIESSVPR